VVCGKAGKEAFGFDCFFSSIQQRPKTALDFFAFSLINVRQKSYPVKVDQAVQSDEEKAASNAKKQAKKYKRTDEKRKPDRPKDSKNNKSSTVVLNAELLKKDVCLDGVHLKGDFSIDTLHDFLEKYLE
jgi:hypothetical protein